MTCRDFSIPRRSGPAFAVLLALLLGFAPGGCGRSTPESGAGDPTAARPAGEAPRAAEAAAPAAAPTPPNRAAVGPETPTPAPRVLHPPPAPPAPSALVAVVELPRPASDAVQDDDAAPLAARRTDGGRLVVFDTDDPAGTRRSLAAEFAGVRDPRPTMDGRKLLFSGKKRPGDRWQIWSVSVAGDAPHQLFEHPSDCFHPAEHFGGHVAFAAVVDDAVDTSGRRPTTALFVGDPVSGRVDRTTRGVGPAFDPVVLEDGRTGFAALRRADTATLPAGRAALYAMNWDGTNFTALLGVGQAPRMRSHPTPLDDGLIAFLGGDDPEDVDAGQLYVSSFYDPYPPARRIDAPDAGWEAEGRFAAVTELGGGLLLASYRPSADEGYGLWLVHADCGARASLLAAPPGRDLVDVVAVRHSPQFLGRLTGVKPEQRFGWLYAQDARRLGEHEAGDDWRGRPERVRIIEGRPLPVADRKGDGAGGAGTPPRAVGGAPPVMSERVLGEVPLAEDGSFYVKVPADRPLRLQLVDRNGYALASETGWQWVRPNEARGCVGCHTGGQIAPRNRAPLATSAPPVDLSADLSGEREGRRDGAVDFVHDVGPALADGCGVSGCHAGPRPTGGHDFSGDGALVRCRREAGGDTFACPPAYASLLATRPGVPPVIGGALVHPGDARSSPLVWMQFGRQLAPQVPDAPWERPLGQPHPPDLDDETRRSIALWIDLGAPLDVRTSPKTRAAADARERRE